MKTLLEAWEWYESSLISLQQMQRIGGRYWNDIPWTTAAIGRDDNFIMLEMEDIEAATAKSLAPIEDLAVVVLFSVFESLVRQYLVDQIRPEMATLSHPILMASAEDAVRGVEEGSFYLRVLQPLKSQNQVSADLVTEVNQVRDYRNWVAHGGRGDPKNLTTPRMAYERLKRFLEAIEYPTQPKNEDPPNAQIPE